MRSENERILLSFSAANSEILWGLHKARRVAVHRETSKRFSLLEMSIDCNRFSTLSASQISLYLGVGRLFLKKPFIKRAIRGSSELNPEFGISCQTAQIADLIEATDEKLRWDKSARKFNKFTTLGFQGLML